MKRTIREVAEAIGVKEYNLSRWLRGLNGARLDEAERLTAVVPGTTITQWMRPVPSELKRHLGI